MITVLIFVLLFIYTPTVISSEITNHGFLNAWFLESDRNSYFLLSIFQADEF